MHIPGAKILSRRGSQGRAIRGGVRPEFGGEIETRDPRAVILTFYPRSHFQSNVEGIARNC